MPGFCEHGNERRVTIKCGDFFLDKDHLTCPEEPCVMQFINRMIHTLPSQFFVLH